MCEKPEEPKPNPEHEVVMRRILGNDFLKPLRLLGVDILPSRSLDSEGLRPTPNRDQMIALAKEAWATNMAKLEGHEDHHHHHQHYHYQLLLEQLPLLQVLQLLFWFQSSPR